MTDFTQKFCDVAGIAFDAFTYCKTHLCPVANEFESDKDSLTDFLEKLEILTAEGIVGEWSLTQVTKGHKPYLAVHLPAVWGEFERRFTPTYNRQSIQQLVEGQGGTVSTQKFVATKQEWGDYLKAKAEFARGDRSRPPTRPVKQAARKCLLIPAPAVNAVIRDPMGDDYLRDNFSDYTTLVEDEESEVPISSQVPGQAPIDELWGALSPQERSQADKLLQELERDQALPDTDLAHAISRYQSTYADPVRTAAFVQLKQPDWGRQLRTRMKRILRQSKSPTAG